MTYEIVDKLIRLPLPFVTACLSPIWLLFANALLSNSMAGVRDGLSSALIRHHVTDRTLLSDGEIRALCIEARLK
jgi:hypothetical protein